MTRFPACLHLLPLCLATLSVAQSVPTLKANTKIVVIDVVVTDKQGNPVKNLKASDFSLTENNTPQTIGHFDAHTGLSAEDAAKIEAMPKLAPNIFTNYSPVPVDSSLNVMLIDDLNTPINFKTIVIQQALKYLSMPHPGARMEIFELVPEGAGLKLIQGFTSDPEILRAALTNRKVVPQSSIAVDDPLRACGGGDVGNPAFGSMLPADADVGSTSGGIAECLAMLLQRRSISTLQAMAALARYMGTLPGRKNLLWFSSSFPMPVNKRDVQDELHRTMSLFAKSQVAVYPIVAGGLMKAPDPAPPGPGVKSSVDTQNHIAFFAKTDNEQATMERMAEDTGGKVFAKTNDLAGAAGQAVNDGSNYYTLTYTPANRDWKGEFRSVKVLLAQKGYTLAYRPGYYADDDDKPGRKEAVATADIAPPDPARVALNSAMEYGSPQPSDVVLKVAVNPATGQPETTVAKLNVMSPKVSAPFERYVLSVAALPTAFTFTRDTPGKIHMAARLVTRVYSADGTLINKTTVNAIGDIDDARYQSIMADGLQFKQEISVPVKGESFLRIGVEDIPTNRVGVVEIPVATVAKLKPLATTTPTPK